MQKKALAEFFGTFWLVFGGCGAAVLAAGVPGVGIGWLGVSFAFGLTVMTMAFAIGHISGCHLNPAVSLGLAVGKRFPIQELPAYVVAQLLGGAAGAAVLYVIASGTPGFDLAAGFAANGFGAHSPGGYSLMAGAVAEVGSSVRHEFMPLIAELYDHRLLPGLHHAAVAGVLERAERGSPHRLEGYSGRFPQPLPDAGH